MGNSFMTDYEKMIDFCIMPKNEFLKFYGYLSEKDYLDTIKDIITTSEYWNDEWSDNGYDGTSLKDIILGMMITDWLKTKKKNKKEITNKRYVWIIEGTGDDGDWETEVFDSYEKARNQFNEYIHDFTSTYTLCNWVIDGDSAQYCSSNYYGTFWIKRVEVK